MHQPLEQQEVTSLPEMVNQKTSKEKVQRKIQVIDAIAQPQRHAQNRGISATTINKISEPKQQQNTQETQQRPAKMVPVLPPVSLPMQQVPSMGSSTTSSKRKENQRSLAHPANKKSQTGSTARGNGARKVSSTRPIFTTVAELPTALKPEDKENGFPYQLVYTQETQQKSAKLVPVLHQVSSSKKCCQNVEKKFCGNPPFQKHNIAMEQMPSASAITSSNRNENQKSQNDSIARRNCTGKTSSTRPIFTDFQQLTQLSTVSKPEVKENGFPKPAYSYSLLIALALKNSYTSKMTVKEIYTFLSEHFPYFKNAPNQGNLLRGIVIWSSTARSVC